MPREAMRLDLTKAEWFTNPWTWITSFFLLQFLGSLLVIQGFRINPRDIYPSMAFLVLGTLISGAFAWLGPRIRISEGGARWVPALFYALFIFSLSQKSFRDVTSSVNTDIFHPLEYWSLSLLLCWWIEPGCRSRSLRTFALRVFAVGMAYGFLDEAHQAFIPGREPSLLDLALDLTGIALGWGTFLTLHRLFRALTTKCPPSLDP